MIHAIFLVKKQNKTILLLLFLYPNGDNQWHFNEQDKANCFNDYFASISSAANDEHNQLHPFTKLTDNSLSHINCTEHKKETTNEVLSPNKASGDDGISHKMLKSPNLFQNPYVF